MLNTGVDGKTCYKCNEWKTYKEYSKDSSRDDGYHPYCKRCKSKDNKDLKERINNHRKLTSNIFMVLPDTQAPAHHIDTIPFLKAVKHKYQPKTVIHIGDELDFYWLSEYLKEAQSDNPTEELNKGIDFMYELYAVFPNVQVLESNHVHGRLNKAAQKSRFLPQMLKHFPELINAPKGWTWHKELIIGDILFRHGDRTPKGLKRVVEFLIPKEFGRHYNIVLGHHHTEMGQATPDIWVGHKAYWGAFTGSLIDYKHDFFKYTERKPMLGCLIIIDGKPRAVPLIEDGDGRWTGELI